MSGGRSGEAAQRFSGQSRPFEGKVSHFCNRLALKARFEPGIITCRTGEREETMATEQLAPGTVSPPVPEHDRMPIHGIDHIEMYVGNAAQSSHYFCSAFGF